MHLETIGYIKQAIISEIEGYEFYKLAASKARTNEMKEIYLELGEEERKHVEWLQELMQQLDSKDQRVELESIKAPESPGIFNWKNLDREDPQTTLSIFGIALQLEKASYEFYGNAAKTIENEDAVALFKILESWEKAHYETFNKEYELLQNDWWAEQRFSPF